MLTDKSHKAKTLLNLSFINIVLSGGGSRTQPIVTHSIKSLPEILRGHLQSQVTRSSQTQSSERPSYAVEATGASSIWWPRYWSIIWNPWMFKYALTCVTDLNFQFQRTARYWIFLENGTKGEGEEQKWIYTYRVDREISREVERFLR